MRSEAARSTAAAIAGAMRQSPEQPLRADPVKDAPATQLRDGELLAAVDLGSNSFHLVVARYEHGGLRIIDRLRDSVRM